MSEQATKTADQLTVGEHISDPHGVHEVVSVVPYRNGDGRQHYAVTLRPLGPAVAPFIEKHEAAWRYALATDAEISEWKAEGDRRALADALHKLADDIIDNKLPVPRYTVHFSAGVLGSRAELDRWAAYLDAEVEGGKPGDPIPSVCIDRPVVDRMTLEIRAQIQPKKADTDAPAGA